MSNTITTAPKLDWAKLGRELRISADSCAGLGGEACSIQTAYQFLLDNPECFGFEDWPEDMPTFANPELVAAYQGRSAVRGITKVRADQILHAAWNALRINVDWLALEQFQRDVIESTAITCTSYKLELIAESLAAFTKRGRPTIGRAL